MTTKIVNSICSFLVKIRSKLANIYCKQQMFILFYIEICYSRPVPDALAASGVLIQVTLGRFLIDLRVAPLVDFILFLVQPSTILQFKSIYHILLYNYY